MVNLNNVLYPHLCDLVPRTAPINAAGEPVTTDGEMVGGVRCHFQPRGSTEQVGRVTVVGERDKLFLPWGTRIEATWGVENVRNMATGEAIEAGPLEVYGRPAKFDGSHIEAELEGAS